MNSQSKITDGARTFLIQMIKAKPRATATELREQLEARKWFGGEAPPKPYFASLTAGLRRTLGLSLRRKRRNGPPAASASSAQAKAEALAGPPASPASPATPAERGRQHRPEIPLRFCPCCGLDLENLREIMRVAATLPKTR